MQPILFWIPLHSILPALPDVPVYGYGTMLFLAFVGCTWLAWRLGRGQGITKEVVQDLAIWLFVSGILGARIDYLIEYTPLTDLAQSPLQFFAVWDGGLVVYGSFIGATIGYFLAYHYLLRKRGIRFWQMADIIAPCVALGLCLGRIGCLLNGCCYGGVACPGCPEVSFPLSAMSRYTLTARGYQTAAGFTMAEKAADPRMVGKVEAGSAAERHGLRAGDVIVKAEGQDVKTYADLVKALTKDWRRDQRQLSLTVLRGGPAAVRIEEVVLPPFEPLTLGLHPTQLYESISAALLLLLLLAFLPFRRFEGQAFVLFLLCYAVHRFLNEMLRDDTQPWETGLKPGQNLSVAVFAAALLLGLWLWRTSGRPHGRSGPAQEMPARPARLGVAPAAR
jgi:phosphatidylglycerol:prolipoprotein diacylglycerol transferase